MHNMNSFDWQCCPLCGANEVHKIGPIDYRRPIFFSTQEIKLCRTPLLYECSACESWFTQHIIPQDEALSLYESGASSEKWPDTPPLHLGKSRNIIERLGQYIIPGSRVLDVGANTGELLDHARRLGAETFAVEPSKASQQVLKRKGHQVFAALGDVIGDFDIITAFDLVEHLYDLPSFLVQMNRMLVAGGVLIILTGDRHSRSAKLSSNNWWYLKAPEHIVFPSQKYLSNVPGFKLAMVDATYASRGYERTAFVQALQFIRKKLFCGGFDGSPPLGPDHMLATMQKVTK